MIILTGATGGIGRAILPYLLEIDSVIGIYNNTKPKKISNDKLSYERVNLEKIIDIRNFLKKWKNRLSHITIVHAATLKIDGIAANYSQSNWERMMRVNLRGNFLLNQALLPFMIKEQWGRIIHISSLGGIQGSTGTIAYSTTKTGLLGMSRVLAKEYARFNITSNVLTIGYIKVGLFNSLKKELKRRILEQIPSKRLGDSSNIANAIEFLIKSDYVNGATINIDGGI